MAELIKPVSFRAATPLSYGLSLAPCVHVTVARWRPGRVPRALPGLFAQYAGPWWSAGEVALIRGDQREGGSDYRTVRRVALERSRSGEQGGSACP